MLFCDLIEKTLSSNALPLPSTPPTDPGASPKPSLLFESGLKNEKWNQAELGYFDLHIKGVYGEGKVVSMEKEIYYRNVMLFMQQIQSLVTF